MRKKYAQLSEFYAVSGWTEGRRRKNLRDKEKMIFGLLYLHSMVQQGNTMFLVEHNLDILKAADYVIELGPGGGAKGGHLLFAGTPRDMLSSKDSITALFLRQEISPVTLN